MPQGYEPEMYLPLLYTNFSLLQKLAMTVVQSQVVDKKYTTLQWPTTQKPYVTINHGY